MNIYSKNLFSAVPGFLFALLCGASEGKLKSIFGWVPWQPREIFLRRYYSAYFVLLVAGFIVATAMRFTTSDVQVGRGWLSLMAISYLIPLFVTGLMTACTSMIANGIH